MLDVSLLYTNIPHNKGIVACEEALNSKETQVLPAGVLCHFFPVNFTIELVYVQQKSPFTLTRYCHGYPYGSIKCQLVHGEVGTRVPTNPEQENLSVVEVYVY